jgi:hypothetical protein
MKIPRTVGIKKPQGAAEMTEARAEDGQAIEAEAGATEATTIA